MSLFQSDFEWSEFAQRRERVFDAIGPDAIAVLQGAGPVSAYNLFFQEKAFYYLTGIEVPQAYVVLRGSDRSTTLYLAPQRQDLALGDRALGPQDAELICSTTGLSAVKPLSDLGADLQAVKVVYAMFAPAEIELTARDVLVYAEKLSGQEPLGAFSTRHRQFLTQLMGRAPMAEFKNLTSIVDNLRLIKSPAEIKLMRHAAQLSAKAVDKAIRVTKLGMGEYDLEAIALYVYRAGGAFGAGYKTIAPCGKRIWDPHYIENTEKLEDGELVLMDGAPDYRGYTSDIGRMWPVNGKYSPVQRELYGFVVQLHEETLKRIRPGVTALEILGEVKEAMLPVWEKHPWSKESYREAGKTLLDFKGTFSHTVGMAVHDSNTYWGMPLAPGMVFTVDPQLWVRDERVYIRVEDTVLVTETGVEVLTEGPPRDLDATEALIGTEDLWS